MTTTKTVIHLSNGTIVKCDPIHPIHDGNTKSVTVKNASLVAPDLREYAYNSFTILKSHIVAFTNH